MIDLTFAQTARLWEKVHIPLIGTDDHWYNMEACWPWTGALSKKRRGRRPNIKIAGKNYNPARIVCTNAHGPAPGPDFEVGHTCPNGENALCMNPSHMRWMTRLENERSKRRPNADTDHV